MGPTVSGEFPDGTGLALSAAFRRELERRIQMPKPRIPSWRSVVRMRPGNHGGVALRAASWQTCAVGERREQLKEQGYVFREECYPADQEVARLGEAFHWYIQLGAWEKAEIVLDQLDELASKPRESYPIVKYGEPAIPIELPVAQPREVEVA